MDSRFLRRIEFSLIQNNELGSYKSCKCETPLLFFPNIFWSSNIFQISSLPWHWQSLSASYRGDLHWFEFFPFFVFPLYLFTLTYFKKFLFVISCAIDGHTLYSLPLVEIMNWALKYRVNVIFHFVFFPYIIWSSYIFSKFLSSMRWAPTNCIV